MKRERHLFEKLVSEENLYQAIRDVNKSHHYYHKNGKTKINQTALWVELTQKERVEDLQRILHEGFHPSPMRHMRIYDQNAGKERDIYEPKLWPDQYVHHALIQVLKPAMMRGMDFWCCGSIEDRGAKRGITGIKKWLRYYRLETHYVLQLDIRHFYDSIQPRHVIARMKQLIKDRRVLGLIEVITADGIRIGSYCSQWFANTLLQPLDQLIRKDRLCHYYVRYMDNITVFGSNKRLLRRLFMSINNWLGSIDLKIKGNWQLFQPNERMVDAIGYRYDHKKCFARKGAILRLRRAMKTIWRQLSNGRGVSFKMASGILSRLGILRWCNGGRIYQSLCDKGFIKQMKQVIRTHFKKSGGSKWKNIVSARIGFGSRLSTA